MINVDHQSEGLHIYLEIALNIFLLGDRQNSFQNDIYLFSFRNGKKYQGARKYQ